MPNRGDTIRQFKLREMNGIEIAFIISILFLHLVLFLNVIFNYAKWAELPFLFAFLAMVLTFVQYFVRYLAITILYNTESSIYSWIVSLLILIISSLSIYLLNDLNKWMISYGVLLLFAGIKNLQTRRKMTTMKIFSDEREARLKEFSTVEVSFGILILLGATVLNTKLLDVLVLDYKSILISITFFTFYFSFVSLLISIIRIVTHKSLIDKFFTEKY